MSLWTNTAVCEQWWNTGSCNRRAVSGRPTWLYGTWEGHKILSAHNTQQCPPTTNPRSLFPIRFYNWSTAHSEVLEEEGTKNFKFINPLLSVRLQEDILKISHGKTFGIYQHDTQASYCPCLPHIRKYVVCLMSLSLMKAAIAFQRNSCCYYRLPYTHLLLIDTIVKWIRDPNTLITLTCYVRYSTMSSSTKQTPTLYDISWRLGQISKEVKSGHTALY